jgi:Family of unknown function (DUF5407)
MKTNSLALLFIPLLSCFLLSQTAQADNPGTAKVRKEIIALEEKLITAMSQAETDIGNDVELVHASIPEHLETVDTEAAYLQAKSLIADIQLLRRHAIADLTLPSDFTPPEVPPPMARAAVSTDPQSALALSYQDIATVQHLFAEIEAETALLQKELLFLLTSGDLTIEEMFETQVALNTIAQLSNMTAAVISGTNAAISGVARNVHS